MSIKKQSTFRGGKHVPDHKGLTNAKSIERMPAPKTVYISLAQHIGKPSKVAVTAGERVKKGQMVGEEVGFISACVYSSVSGVVKEIKTITTPFGAAEYVVIENDGLEEEISLPPIDKDSGAEISERVRKAGIVGLGGAGWWGLGYWRGWRCFAYGRGRSCGLRWERWLWRIWRSRRWSGFRTGRGASGRL